VVECLPSKHESQSSPVPQTNFFNLKKERIIARHSYYL
jgi:hypothetical protein